MAADRTITVTLAARITDYKAKMLDASRVAADFGKRSQKALVDHRDSLNSTGSAALKMGGALVLGVGLAMRAYSQFDSAMSKVAATGSDARANLAGLRLEALTTGPALGASATEAAEGIEALLKAGVTAKDVMGGGLSGALTLAAAGVMDVGDAAEVAATAMTQFKLSGKDVPHIADLLAAGAGKAQGEVSDMAMALKQSGLVASQFNISIEETVGTLTAFAGAGLLGSDAGTSFRTMLLRLANPAGESAKLMEKLGIAAYDSQGKFVGISALAEQLKQRLGGLTEQQRSSALATIFGSDAIRAANVLYENGSAGIDKWTKSVDDQGYAAEVARVKLDNLQGDIKRLGAASEAAFIQMGTGADGPFRGVVKNITGMVEAFSRLPASLQQGSLLIAAIGGAALLAAGGMIKLAVGAVDTWRSFRELAPAGSKLSGTLGAIGKAALAAGVALAALNAAAPLIGFKAGITSASDLQNTLLKLGSGSTGGLDDLQAKFKGIVPGVNDLRDALIKLDQPNYFRDIMAKIGGFSSDTEILRAQFDSLDRAISQMDTADAATAFQKLSEQMSLAGYSTEQIVAMFPQYKAQLAETANQMKVTVDGTQQWADWMGGKVPDAITAATSAQTGYQDNLKGLPSATDDATDSLKAMLDQLKGIEDTYLSVSDAQIDFEAAIDDTTKAIRANGKGLDVNTAKGRANRGELNRLVERSTAYIRKLAETGASSDKVAGAQERARAKFRAAAIAAGMGADKAGALAKKLFAIPKNTTANVKVTVQEPNIGAYMASLQRRVNANPLYIPAHAPNRIARAYGGPLPGEAPHDRADNVLYAGTPGEWVIQRPTTRYYGDDIMAKINAGYFPKEALQKLAWGGPVGGSARTEPSASATPPQQVTIPDGTRLRIVGIDKIADYAEARLETAMDRG